MTDLEIDLLNLVLSGAEGSEIDKLREVVLASRVTQERIYDAIVALDEYYDALDKVRIVTKDFPEGLDLKLREEAFERNIKKNRNAK
jgi:hypothetical protein